MEQQRVVIIGAGPAGLTLGLSLAQQGVASIVLEKDVEATKDPRGVYLAADAVRILYALGLERHMPVIGHELEQVQFHRGSIAHEPFHAVNLIHDKLHQAVPNGILQIQPALENALRTEVNASKLCELRLGCEVKSLEEWKDGVRVTYTEHGSGHTKHIQTAWLVGADGKTGVVRKTFLEPLAGIRQGETSYRYEGCWVASNLHITNPTPQSHPDLPFWGLGMQPEDVYDLYWPKGWHFASPPVKATASGRFGPHEKHLWRHEFAQDNWNADMNAEDLLWEHITPMITRSEAKGTTFAPLAYPRDCIEILRCRPFTFSHKLVNRWFHKKTVLIGDAAHVFPPFGGQGIASGIRDAHQLAWRLALLEACPTVDSDALLMAWSREREQSISDAALLTRMNGLLCNEGNILISWLLPILQFVMSFLGFAEFDPQHDSERRGFSRVSDGFSLPRHHGGLRLPQLCVDTLVDKRLWSDHLLTRGTSTFKLLVLSNQTDLCRVADVKAVIKAAELPSGMLDASSITLLCPEAERPDAIGHCSEKHTQKAAACPDAQLPYRLRKIGYTSTALRERLGNKVKFIVMRPDFYVFAAAHNLAELEGCLQKLRAKCEGR